MIDFNLGKEQFNEYTGSEKKTTMLYGGERYMLKYPDPVRNKKIKGELMGGLSYKNNQFSEHIGCCIFRSCGFETQETVLGHFTDKEGKKKIVVGCKDFTQQGGKLFEINKLGNQTLVNQAKLDATIENVYGVINDCDLIENKSEILNGFWDMFVVDALIGNGDRHLGNWGILVKDSLVKLAPVYDCGSSLGAMLDDSTMEEMLQSSNEFKNQAYNKLSCYYMNGKRIFYHEIFKKPPTELQEAIKRVVPRIDMEKICNIIDSTPHISNVRKEYLKKAVELRYKQIIVPSFKRCISLET